MVTDIDPAAEFYDDIIDVGLDRDKTIEYQLAGCEGDYASPPPPESPPGATSRPLSRGMNIIIFKTQQRTLCHEWSVNLHNTTCNDP